MGNSKKSKIENNLQYIIPSTNDGLRLFSVNNKIDMMEHIISSIDYALKNKLDIIEVFQFKNSKFVITLSEKDFESNVDNIVNFYIKNEIYELCTKAQSVQRVLKNKITNEKK